MNLISAAGWLEQVMSEAMKPSEAVLLVGQVLFGSRFYVQWIATERKKEVVVPEVFWWLSLFGASISLVALIWKHEPVLMVAQAGGLFIYTRNLVIHRRTVAAKAE
ncbi:MAG: lipid-A-disaccharide synthase N-terminal domain-containing protein [Planctomycetota bacterium]|jgi:lipid-A-disaccharide synthase-like uncharacterized protein